MTTLLIHHRVADYEAWKAVYDSVEDMQRDAGVRSERVWRSADDPNMVVVEHEFDSREAAKEFMDRSDLQEAMARSGVDRSSMQAELLDEASRAARA
jgi:quinol monooxygenase YgiN